MFAIPIISLLRRCGPFKGPGQADGRDSNPRPHLESAPASGMLLAPATWCTPRRLVSTLWLKWYVCNMVNFKRDLNPLVFG